MLAIPTAVPVASLTRGAPSSPVHQPAHTIAGLSGTETPTKSNSSVHSASVPAETTASNRRFENDSGSAGVPNPNPSVRNCVPGTGAAGFRSSKSQAGLLTLLLQSFQQAQAEQRRVVGCHVPSHCRIVSVCVCGCERGGLLAFDGDEGAHFGCTQMSRTS